MHARMLLWPIAVVLTAPAVAPAEVVIDTFATQQILQLDPSGSSPLASFLAAPEAVGGERELVLHRLAGGGFVDLLVNAIGEQRLSCSAAASTQGRCDVTWDGPDASFVLDTDGLGGLDLTQGGANDAFRVLSATDVPAALTITVVKASDGSSVAAALPLPGGDVDLVERFLPLSAFGVAGPATLSDVGAISLTVTGPGGLDASLDDVVFTVPEPASPGVAALASLLVLAAQRARNRGPRG